MTTTPTETVLSSQHQSVVHRYTNVPDDVLTQMFVPDLDEGESMGDRTQIVHVGSRIWRDLGSPDTLTVTYHAGDRLTDPDVLASLADTPSE